MRVLHVLAPMREGGLERVVTMLAAAQLRDGVHVAAVIEPREADNHQFVDRLLKLGVPVTALRIGARCYRSEYRELRTMIAKLDPQIVHTHGYRADVIAGAAARRAHIPHVSTVHGFTGGGAGFRNRFYELLQRSSLRWSNGVIAVSVPLVDQLTRAGVPRARIRVVRNGFVAAEILDRATARARLGLAEGERIIGWVGRLSAEKGCDVMLDALALADPSWRLSIVGEGAEMASLRTQAARLGISDRVSWHGSVPDAGSSISAFDVLVLSSRTEGTPIVLFEAMNAGVPIVATAVGGVPDVVTREHALLVPSERPDMIAAALATVLEDSAATRRRLLLGRARVAEQFNVSSWVAAVDSVYAEITARD